MSTPTLVAEAVAIMKRLRSIPDTAAQSHYRVMAAFQQAGWNVMPEYRIDLPDGRRGRIDLVVETPGAMIAIEIDTRKPREKSLRKLALFNGGRIIALRGVGGTPKHVGEVDAVVRLSVRLAGDKEARNKRTVSRLRQL